MEITEYKLLEAFSYAHLEELVNDSLKEGWLLGGNLVVSKFNDGSYLFHKEMIKVNLGVSNAGGFQASEVQ